MYNSKQYMQHHNDYALLTGECTLRASALLLQIRLNTDNPWSIR